MPRSRLGLRGDLFNAQDPADYGTKRRPPPLQRCGLFLSFFHMNQCKNIKKTHEHSCFVLIKKH